MHKQDYRKYFPDAVVVEKLDIIRNSAQDGKKL